MTNQEFSNEFDILYNSITSNQAPGLDEYEKSVFLTNGQNDIIRMYSNPRENKPQQGIDESKKRQIDFSSLMKTSTLSESVTTNKFDNRSISYRLPNDLLIFINEACRDKNYRYVAIPISYDEYDRLMLKPYQYPVKRGVWRLLVDSSVPESSTIPVDNNNSTITIKNSSLKKVVFSVKFISGIETSSDGGILVSKEGVGKAPVIEEDAYEVKITCTISSSISNTSTYWQTFLVRPNTPWESKIKEYTGGFGGVDSVFPAVGPTDNFTVEAGPATPFIELIGKVDKDSFTYTVRYLRRPRPIILTNLDEGLSIQGRSKESTCELDESLHQEILQRAVELAKAAYNGDLQSQIALGQASQTDIGVIQSSK